MSRRAMHVAGVGLFLCCAVVSYLITLAVMAEPMSARDYSVEMNEILERVSSEGDDATDLLNEAIERVDALFGGSLGEHAMTEAPRQFLTLQHLLAGDWGDPAVAAHMALWREANRQVAPLLHEAAQRQVILAPFDPTGDSPWSPKPNDSHRVRVQTLVVLPVVAVRDAAEREDWDEFVRAIETGIRLARLQLDRPSTIDLRYGLIGFNWLLREVRYQSLERSFPADVRARLIEELRAIDPRPRDFSAAAEMAGVMIREEARSRYSDAGFALWWDFLWQTYPPQGAAPTFPDRLGNYRALNSPRWSDLEKAVHREVESAIRWWEHEFVHFRRSPIRPDMRMIRQGDVTLRMFVDFYDTVLGLVWLDTNRTGTILMLQLFAHWERSGQWPESLAALAALDQSIDPQIAESFEYELTPDDPDGSPFRLEPVQSLGARWMYSIPSQSRPALEIR